MTETLGVGIIGCGNISTTYLSLAPLFRGIDIRAVADMNMAAATARAEEHGVVAQSVEDLLGNPEIDIVINLTVPDAHVPVSKSILEAGKHVFSEKPLSLSVEDGLALRDLAEATNAGRQPFGFDRTMEVIRQGCLEGLSPRDLIERLMGEVKAFTGDEPQADDMTCVVVKIEA